MSWADNIFLIEEPAPEKAKKTDNSIEDLNDIGVDKYKKIANSSMKAYFMEGGEGYKSLLSIIEDRAGKLWKDKNDTPTYDEIKDSFPDCDNFLSVSLQQDNEVIFTNLFYYFFQKYPQLVKKFFVVDESRIIVERERQKMDIRIVDDNKFIIIENKIKSGINGTKEKKSIKKIGAEMKFLSNRSNGIEYLAEDYNGELKITSQLSDYYKKAEKKIRKKKKRERLIVISLRPTIVRSKKIKKPMLTVINIR